MCKLIYILNCAILVTSNPLQGFQSCPLTIYPNYDQPDQPPTIPLNNFSPYQHQLIVQNQLTPSYQTIAYLNNDQTNRLYFDKGMSNPNFSSFANPIISIYDQNGIEIKRYIVNPRGTTPNYNNYVIVPSELLNQSTVNKKDKNNSTKKYIEKKYIETPKSEQLKIPNYNTSKKNKNVDENTISTDISNKNIVPATKADKEDLCRKNSKRENGGATIKRKSSKNKYKKSKSLNGIEDYVETQDRRHKKHSKLMTNDGENVKSLEDIEKNNSHKKTKKTESDSKKLDKKSKIKSKKKQAQNDIQDELSLQRKPKETNINTADVEVCFDINEDCAYLENRRTRNNKNDYRINNQQKFPKDFSDNFGSYMNNAIYNQQLNPNFYNSIANYPFNFDYIYRILQQSNAKPNVSGKRRKNKRKKQKSNKENNKTKENKNQDSEKATSSDCEKVIELSPQYMEIEQTTELVNVIETTPFNEDIADEAEEKTKQDVEIILTLRPLADANEPIASSKDSSMEATSQNTPAIGLEDDTQCTNENYIIDEYYPDFTSDNNYVSKEEFEINNFHDRYYYTSDKEMSSEKRQYERANEKNLSHFNNHEVNAEKENKLRKKDHSNELSFRTPPALEFPDFKTEMIDKDEIPYHDYENNYGDNNERRNVKTYSDIEAFNLDSNNRDNEVETVFANSKVVKYGAPPNKKEIPPAIDLSETSKRDDKNLLSTDGVTTVVLARSIGYNDY